jgi:AhpC/TSA family
MRKTATYLLLFLLAMAAVPGAPLQGEEKEKPAPLKLKVGDMAPDFKLKYYDGSKLQDISLHEFHGKKNVVVAFFVFAFTGG